MKQMLRLTVLLLTIFISTNSFAQFPTIYATLGSGAWTATTVWESFTGNATNTPGAQGTGTPYTGGTNPSGTHFVYIRSGHTITMGANRSCLGMTVENGGTLLAGGSFRLQLVTGGTGFTFPQTGTITNNGTIGGGGDGIYFEVGTNAAAVTITGTGSTTVARLRIPGGLANHTVSVTIDQNISFTQAANYALSAVYNPTATDIYSITINPGKTVTLTAADGFFHNSQNLATYGSYTYNIKGTLDLSANTQTVNNVSANISGPPTGGSVTINVDGGILKTGATFKVDTLQQTLISYNPVTINIKNGGVVDASLTSNLGAGNNGDGAGNYNKFFFISDGTGGLKRSVGATATAFPVGTSATSNNPVSLTNAGTSDAFTVNVTNTVSTPPVTPIVNKQWNITEAATGANVTASFGWVTADESGSFSHANPIDVMRYTGSAWTPYGLTSPTVGSGTVASPYVATSATGFTAFGKFGINNGGILPVSFTGIAAALTAGGVNVTWNIATEVNTASYEIEKSTDGTNYSPIGSVAATNAGKYSYIDASPASGVNLYRIKAVDKDGKFMYSSVVRINSASSSVASLSVYPNPVIGGQLNLQISNFTNGNYQLRLIGINGQTAFTKTIISNGSSSSFSVQLPGSVVKGLYQLELTDGISSRTVKTVSIQ